MIRVSGILDNDKGNAKIHQNKLKIGVFMKNLDPTIHQLAQHL